MEEKIIYKNEVKTFEKSVERKYYNYRLILYACMIGLSFMFLSLSFSYFITIYPTVHTKIQLVPVFYWNTIILLASSGTIYYMQYQFKKDNYVNYKSGLIATVCLIMLFIAGQIIAWLLQFFAGYAIQHTTSKYLYVISGVHLLHIIGGYIFLLYFLKNSWVSLKEYATSIIYFTDPVIKNQLHLFGTYWHFLGITWIYLLVFFLIIG